MLFGITHSISDLRTSLVSNSNILSRPRSTSAADEAASKIIDKMMDTKDVIERWKLERTLKTDGMTEEEKSRWVVDSHRKPRSFLQIIGLVSATVLVSGIIVVGLLFLVLHSTSVSWARWIWFAVAMLSGIFVDAFAVKCLSGEDGDLFQYLLFKYLRGVFRTTSRQEAEYNNGGDEITIQEEDIESATVIQSPMFEQVEDDTGLELAIIDTIDENNDTPMAPLPTTPPRRKPSMIKTQSIRDGPSVQALTTQFNKEAHV